MLDNSFEGYVKVSQSFGQRMFTLRANLSSTKVKAAIKSVIGGPVPKRGFCDTYACLLYTSPSPRD